MNEDKPLVLLGITGCIAAYKSCELIRVLQKRGCCVKVVMTEHATHFVGPTTFRALTHEPVALELFDEASDPIHHVSLAQECDVFTLAPCTANVIAKVAHGIADDLLTTTTLACTAPIVLAPAMNVHMYEAAATQENLNILRNRGVHIVDAESGYLACGEEGRGRLADINLIADAIEQALNSKCDSASSISSREFERQDLQGVNVLITAGPTIEPIDAVRYISNYSSGKMGYALARAAAHRGAQVTLVTGPVSLDAPVGVECISVKTADEMLAACQASFPNSDIALFAAAVADMRPSISTERKLKKGSDDELLSSLSLVPNPDILATCASQARANQVVVGFAAETGDVVEQAKRKLISKQADMIVGNIVGDGIAFGCDSQQVVLVTSQAVKELAMLSKDVLADVIFDEILALKARIER